MSQLPNAKSFQPLNIFHKLERRDDLDWLASAVLPVLLGSFLRHLSPVKLLSRYVLLLTFFV